MVFDEVRDLRARVWRTVDMRVCDEEDAESSIPYSTLAEKGAQMKQSSAIRGGAGEWITRRDLSSFIPLLCSLIAIRGLVLPATLLR